MSQERGPSCATRSAVRSSAGGLSRRGTTASNRRRRSCWPPAMRARRVGLAAVAAWCAPAAAPVLSPVARAIGVPTKLPEPAGIAITFDDGPHADGTPLVLETLREHGAVATFFLVGEQVERHPALAAEIVAAGHVVGVHGYRHTL